jgi:hypothetical protein
MPKCHAIRAAYNSRAATVQLGCSYRVAHSPAYPLREWYEARHRHHGRKATDVLGGLMCQATGALTAIAEKRRRMWRFPLIYCVATWEFFLFHPLITINLLMFGSLFSSGCAASGRRC